MKINIWLRSAKYGRGATLRVDVKYESHDTPRVQNYGNRLVKAIESGGTEMELNEEGERL